MTKSAKGIKPNASEKGKGMLNEKIKDYTFNVFVRQILCLYYFLDLSVKKQK